jgi:hypothetical protein
MYLSLEQKAYFLRFSRLSWEESIGGLSLNL